MCDFLEHPNLVSFKFGDDGTSLIAEFDVDIYPGKSTYPILEFVMCESPVIAVSNFRTAFAF